MYYVVIVIGSMYKFLKDDNGNFIRFNKESEAENERIYLQPDYDNLLEVIGIV
ncbi:MAG: hypothetical protein ACTSRG_27060 [Candidatus Helarchaeota archaeon]